MGDQKEGEGGEEEVGAVASGDTAADGLAIVATSGEEASSVVPAKPKRPAPKRDRQADKLALVPAFVLDRGHGRDGELLRDFVIRKEHLREDHRTIATKRWLIREEFLDRWLKEYVDHFAPRGSGGSDAESLEEAAEQMAEACKDALVAKPKKKVEELESSAATTKDVYSLRDTLLEAVKDLTVPRRKLGRGSGVVMNDEAKELLKQKQQMRLRMVVYRCLKGIWESNCGGEVLTMALDAVKARIDRFKSKAGADADVIEAMAGHEWASLEDLVVEIEEKLQEENGDEGGAASHTRQVLGPVEGRRTKLVVERALTELGGRATGREVIEWIEKNPNQLEQLREARLNKHIRDGQKKPVWHSTVMSSLGHFRKAKKVVGQVQVYMLADAAEPEPLAIQDAQEAPPAKKPREKKAKPAPKPPQALQDDAAASKKPRKRPKAAAKQPIADSDAPASAPPESAAPESAAPASAAPAEAMELSTEAPPTKKSKRSKDPEEARVHDAFDAAFAAAAAGQ